MMQTVEEIREALRQIEPEERKRLLLDELEAIEEVNGHDAEHLPENPYARTLALAGTVHSEHTDLSTDKNKHIADAIWERKHG